MTGQENTGRVAEFAAVLRRHNTIDDKNAAAIALIGSTAAYPGDAEQLLAEIRDVLAALREVTS